MSNSPRDDNPANRDPITGKPGSHPAGTAAGAAAGGIAGGAIGIAGGPIGAAVGAAVGAVAGGLAGHAAGEAINPSVEDIYWRQAHTTEPYYRKGLAYEDYAPAYRTGYMGASRHIQEHRRFDEVESELESEYSGIRGNSRLAWEDAKAAVRAAWDRVERALPGDADADGR